MVEPEQQPRLFAAGEAYLGTRRDLTSEILIARSTGRTTADIADSLDFAAIGVDQRRYTFPPGGRLLRS